MGQFSAEKPVPPGSALSGNQHRCISFSGMRADRMVAKEVLERLQPLGVEAALAAIDAQVA